MSATTAEPRDTRPALLYAALDAVVVMDAQGRIVDLNPAAERCFGYARDEALGHEMAELLVAPDLHERHRAELARYLAGGPPVVLGRQIEITAARAGGEPFPVELTITRIELHGTPAFVAYIRDISDRRRREAEHKDLRMRIVAAGDAARRRIERDLHDGAQQRLVALALQLRLARARADNDPARVHGLLDEAIDELAAATAELRELARGIHPVVLTEGGLEPALAGLAGRVALPVTIVGAPRERFPAAVEATAYFIAAEALTNTARHARATRVEICVVRRGAALLLRIGDDGCGGAALDRGTGLRGLADRVAALAGVFAVDSPPGGGTTVHAELPCAS